MECHKCLHAAAVAAGEFQHLPFEETPCAKCTLAEESGKYPLYFDETLSGTPDSPDAIPADDPRLPLSVLTDFIRLFMAMPVKTRDIICMRFAGVSYKEIAVAQGIRPSTVEIIHRRALLRWPVLQHLFKEKVVKQTRRAPYRSKHIPAPILVTPTL